MLRHLVFQPANLYSSGFSDYASQDLDVAPLRTGLDSLAKMFHDGVPSMRHETILKPPDPPGQATFLTAKKVPPVLPHGVAALYNTRVGHNRVWHPAAKDCHPLPDHLTSALAYVSVNGGEDCCPVAGLYLARFAQVDPESAADPDCAGMLTATAVLVACKLIEAVPRAISKFAPTYFHLLTRLNAPRAALEKFRPQIHRDKLDFRRTALNMVDAEKAFLNVINFSLAAPPESLTRYRLAIQAKLRTWDRSGVRSEDAQLAGHICTMFRRRTP